MNKGIALITGCSTGIGRELAQQLVSRGWRVYAGARRPEVLADLAGDDLIPLQLDVNEPTHLQQALELITAKSGRLDLLVNNAGYGAMGPLVEMPLSEVRQQFETNLFAPLALIQTMLPLLQRSQQERPNQQAQVVNIGSVSGVLTTPFSGAYCATKAALHKLSDALRMELAPFGIDVVTIQPGAIESEFGNNAARTLAATLPAESLYDPIRSYIEKRAQASQNKPTPAATFVQELLTSLERRQPPAVKRIGHGSTLLPLIKRLLPERLLDRILSKSFGLSQLKQLKRSA